MNWWRGWRWQKSKGSETVRSKSISFILASVDVSGLGTRRTPLFQLSPYFICFFSTKLIVLFSMEALKNEG